MPSLCPLSNVTLQWMNGVEIRDQLQSDEKHKMNHYQKWVGIIYRNDFQVTLKSFSQTRTKFSYNEINSWWFCQSMRGWRMINRYNNCDKWTIGSEFRLMSWGCWTLTSLEYAEQFVFGSVWRINLQYLANFKWLLCCLLCLCSLFFVLDSTCSPVIHLTWRRMKSPFNWILT